MKKFPSSRRSGFTLIEIMLVVAILALLASIGIPNYLRARKRAQAARLLDDLKAVDHAMELYAVEFKKGGNETMTTSDVIFLKRYLKDRVLLYQSLPYDMFGNEIVVANLNTPPKCPQATFEVLSDVVPREYWAPYAPAE